MNLRLTIRPMYRETLDAQFCQCGKPSCVEDRHITLKASCHPRAGFEAQYADGALTIRCRKCKTHVIVIGVAREPEAFELAI